MSTRERGRKLPTKKNMDFEANVFSHIWIKISFQVALRFHKNASLTVIIRLVSSSMDSRLAFSRAFKKKACSVVVLIFSSEYMYISKILFELLDACEINWKKENFLNVKSDVFGGSQSSFAFLCQNLGKVVGAYEWYFVSL